MKNRIIDKNSIFVIPEELDDLLVLRRVIKKNDLVASETTWSLKKSGEYIRPNKKERVKIKILLQADKVYLVGAFNRLQISGKIIETNNDSISHGSHHSIYVEINSSIKIIKEWTAAEKNLISSNMATGFLLLSVERGNYCIGIVKGTHLQIYPETSFGSTGKQYKTDFNMEKFLDQIKKSIMLLLENSKNVIVFGPGNTKNRVGDYLNRKIKNIDIRITDGIESGGEDGIYVFVKSKIIKNVMHNSKLAKVAYIINEIMLLAGRKSNKFSMGFKQTNLANKYHAVESVVFSYKIIEEENEEEVINFLNKVENSGAKIYGVDSTTDLGLRVNSMGGIVALLRFSFNV